MKALGFDADLVDPPDIICRFNGAKIAVPCKKIYSVANVEKVLSNAVKQVEAKFDYGIAAFNLDDLLPEDAILSANTNDEAGKILDDFNVTFLRGQERHFRKYLESSRLLAAHISTAALATLKNESPGLTNVRQATIWTIPGLPHDKERQLKRFFNQMMG